MIRNIWYPDNDQAFQAATKPSVLCMYKGISGAEKFNLSCLLFQNSAINTSLHQDKIGDFYGKELCQETTNLPRKLRHEIPSMNLFLSEKF